MKRIFTLIAFVGSAFYANSQATHVTISQVYGGGGNTGAPYTSDYIELYNPTSTAVNISNWQVAYASTAGTSWAKTKIPAGTTIQPGKYYLIQQAVGGTVGITIPTPDATGSSNLSATNGKVVLVNDTTTLASNAAPTPATGFAVIDFVGFGTASNYEGSAAAPAGSNTLALFRAGNGATDTDNNSADFTTGAPNPRNSSFVAPLTLNAFTASAINGEAQLNWITANEVNVNGFQIERSANGKDFEAVAFVKANNSYENKYDFATELNGLTYFRLKMMDKDGSFTYSKIVALNSKAGIKLEVFPNPVRTNVIVSHDKADAKAMLRIVSVDGRTVATYNVAAGATQSNIDVKSITKGIYAVVFENGASRSSVQFIKE